MIINNNIASLNAQKNLNATNANMQKSLEKLSSGLRINRAADDAAGLAISEKMRAQIKGLDQAGRNAQDGISLLQTAEGALNETHSILQRMRELVVQAENDTLQANDRSAITSEITELNTEIDRIAKVTSFNGNTLLDGSFTAKNIAIGANGSVDEVLAINLATNMDSATLTSGAVDVTSAANATTSLAKVDAAIDTVSTNRASLGAWQNRLEHTISNLATSAENLTAAESRIRDADMAKEMSSFTKNQVLSQAGVAMLAQANQAPQSVLKLLG